MKQPRPWILAIDPATKCGLAYGQAGSVPTFATLGLRVSKDDGHAVMLGRMRHYLDRNLAKFDAVVVESPVYMPPVVGGPYDGRSNRATDEWLQRLYGQIIGTVGNRDIRLFEVAPPTWRKTFGIPSSGGRDVVKAAAIRQCRLLGWPVEGDDQADAGGLFFYGEAMLSPMNAPQVGPLFLQAGVR